MKAAYSMTDNCESEHNFSITLPVSDCSYALDYMIWYIFNRLMSVSKGESLTQVSPFIRVVCSMTWLQAPWTESTICFPVGLGLTEITYIGVHRCWWVRINKNMNLSLIRETGLEDLWSMLRFNWDSFYSQVLLPGVSGCKKTAKIEL